MNDLDKIFTELKGILASHAPKLNIATDKPGNFYANTNKTDAKNKPIFFGMVKSGKDKVAFHLMPLYEHPELIDGISDELRKRMQGKSCFNFSSLNKELFSELARLTEAGAVAYESTGKI